MSSKEKLECQKISLLLQFYVPNQQTQPENTPTFSNKLRESDVISLVNQNRVRVELFATIVDDAFEDIPLS